MAGQTNNTVMKKRYLDSFSQNELIILNANVPVYKCKVLNNNLIIDFHLLRIRVDETAKLVEF